MRKRRISYLCALGLALAVAIPGTASAAGTQRVEAGFVPEIGGTVPIPPPVLDLPPGFTKGGTLYTRLFLTGFGNNPSSAAVFDIHAPDELKFNTKGLDQCDPATIRGQSPENARSLCEDSFLGLGGATVFAGGVLVPAEVSLFNGTQQNGNPTVLFHSSAGGGPVIISEMQDSPLPGHGVLFHSLVAQAAGGPVPNATPIVDTDFTLSKKFTDQKIAKKAKKTKKKANKASGKKAKKLKKKAKKLKKKSKKSWVQAECTDGTATTTVISTYVSGPPQTAETVQECVVN
jgi:hypothetical protein